MIRLLEQALLVTLLNHGLHRDMVETQTNQGVELIMNTEFS